jgi:hypothetical protein
MLISTRSGLTGRSTRTPTLAMPSAFYWPVLVPCGLRAPAPVNLGVRLQYKLNSGIWFGAVLRCVRGVRTAIRTNRSRGLPAGAFRRLNRAVCPLAASSTLSGAKVPHALALLSACPLAFSAWLFATAVAVAKGIPSPWLRHRDFVCSTGFMHVLWRKCGMRSG